MDCPEPRITGRPVPRWPLRAWLRPPSIEDGRLVAANSVRVYLPFAGLGSRLAATASNRRMNGSIALDYARKRIGVSDRRAQGPETSSHDAANSSSLFRRFSRAHGSGWW